MKIYFFGAKTQKKKLNDNYETIIKTLRSAGADLYTNLKERALPSDLLELRESGGLVLNEMDAFLVEGTESSPDLGYLMALAIAQKKPALYLYEKGSASQEIIKHISGPKIPPTLEVRNYRPPDLEKIVLDFLKTFKGEAVKEIPRIKFTLRITPSIEKYLHYKTHNTAKSKADFLREYVEKMMELDEDFKGFLKKGE